MQAKKNAALVACSLVVAIILGEMAIRLLDPPRIVGPAFKTYDPFYGRHFRKNSSYLLVSRMYVMRMSTNSSGYRGPDVAPGSKRAIVFLGDSMTMGYGVSDGAEYPALVLEALAAASPQRPVPLINAAVTSSGTGHWVKFLSREAAAYAPRLVVLQAHDNDYEENLSEKLFDIGPAGELRELPVPPEAWSDKLRAFADRVPGVSSSHILGVVRQIIWSRPIFTEIFGGAADVVVRPAMAISDNPSAERLTLRLIEEAITICKRNGWPVVVMPVAIERDRRARLMEMLARLDVPAIRLPDRDERPDLYIRRDEVHWNTAGHRAVAGVMLDYISRCCPG